MIKIRVKGLAAVKASVRRLGKQAKKEFERALIAEGEQIMEAADELVPKDTGYLRSTAFTQLDRTRAGVTLELGYNAEYAIYVHERLDLFHEPPTQAKFLEVPVEDAKEHMADRIAEKIARVM